MLDAVASSGADRLSDLLSTRFEEELRRDGQPRLRVLPYSPGYCGWTVRGQRKLFARLGPERTVATVACDSGLKYLSADLYSTG